MILKRRVEAILSKNKQNGISPKNKSELAFKAGMSPQLLTNVLNEYDGPPKPTTVLKLAEALGVTPSYLSGETSGASSDDSDFVSLPLMSPIASAGPGETTEEEQVLNVMKFKTNWLRERVGVNHRRLKIIQADGASMMPTIKPGDNLIVDVENNSFVTDGVYVLRVGDLLMVKRLTMGLSGEIEVTSDNKNHPAFRVDPKRNPHDLVISGRVLARLAVDIERL